MGVALKGLAKIEINVTTAITDLHSGGYGAYVLNAVQHLVQLAATFHNADGRVLVDGFYDRVIDLTQPERQEMALLPIDETDLRKDLDLSGCFNEMDYTLRERHLGRPTLDINGFWGGFQGEGSKTMTPSEAHLKITCRLVPNQDPKEIQQLVAAHVRKHCPPGARAEVILANGNSRPYAVNRDNPVFGAVQITLVEHYGKEPLIVRTGGTVAANGIFQDELGIDAITMAWGATNSNADAPNEWYRISDYLRGRHGYARLLELLAR